MIGHVITAQEVKARWAFSEITSSRFGVFYRRLLPSSLYDFAKSGGAFANVDEAEWVNLEKALKTVRPAGFVDNITGVAGAAQYECVGWSVGDLLNCTTLPVFGEVPYWQFLVLPPKQDERTGKTQSTDPRSLSHTISFDPSFQVQEPLIAIGLSDKKMLFEGYLRSILWLRNPQEPLIAWFPKRQAGHPNTT